MSERRFDREYKTVQAMIRLYCRATHSPREGLCEECRELQDYVRCRLDACPHTGPKPTCSQCPIHCYKPAMREKIKAVMHFAGPRMMTRHPKLALQHLLDGWKGKKPRQ